MNLFASDADPVASAQALADRHVVKMAVETAQVMWTALHLAAPDDVPDGGYRPTHRGHPCVRWAAASRGNFDWAAAHGLALCDEYTHRYGKVHGSQTALERAASLRDLVPDGARTPFALAMDDDLRDVGDPHGSYRRCLSRKYAAWGRMARWTRRIPPVWAIDSHADPV